MRVGIICTATLLIAAGTALAQPAKHDSSRPVHANGKPVEVVLASAETAHPQEPETPSIAPSKRPVPRVTHCRCGDPAPGADAPEE